jgi:hypothetical protein
MVRSFTPSDLVETGDRWLQIAIGRIPTLPE